MVNCYALNVFNIRADSVPEWHGHGVFNNKLFKIKYLNNKKEWPRKRRADVLHNNYVISNQEITIYVISMPPYLFPPRVIVVGATRQSPEPGQRPCRIRAGILSAGPAVFL
jgi:hypothetical protein